MRAAGGGRLHKTVKQQNQKPVVEKVIEEAPVEKEDLPEIDLEPVVSVPVYKVISREDENKNEE